MSFLEFTGENDKVDGNYVFKLEGNKKDLKDKELIRIPSPIIDYNFKAVLANHPEITESMLNSIFYPNNNLIIKVEYLPTDLQGNIPQYPENSKLYGLDSLRADILCKCTLKKEVKEEENIIRSQNEEEEMRHTDKKYNNLATELKKDMYENQKDDEIIKIIDLEMQIGYDIDNTRRFISYAQSLYSKYCGQIIVLSLNFRGFENPRKNKGFEIYLEKKDFSDYKKVTKFDDYVIYQIDLDYCLAQISKNNEQLWILDQNQIMNTSSKEWIKYLTLPIWCKSSTKYYYEFPPLKKLSFNTRSIYDALVILSGQDESQYLHYAKLQEDHEVKVRKFLDLYDDNQKKDKTIKEKDELIEKQKKRIEMLQKEIKKSKKKNGSKKHRKTKYQYKDSSEDD